MYMKPNRPPGASWSSFSSQDIESSSEEEEDEPQQAKAVKLAANSNQGTV